MNANDLVTMLNDAEFLQRQDSNSLEKLIEKHPYFFIAHVLLAKQNSSGQKHSPQPLNAAALQAGDREMLSHFMKEKFLPEKTVEKIREEAVVPLRQRELSAVEMDNEE